ncbi:hypothetical protein [Microbacterium sp. MYb62]|uniref:hypothetical protein n=1 Tax=Microbacterium sp. MYb62 TaxID=1848690 RepID=UPI0011B01F93|nr:hypothetical protein [Microbacterium sp. MYb62]
MEAVESDGDFWGAMGRNVGKMWAACGHTTARTRNLAATGIVAGTTVLALAAFALAIDVAAFAVSQGIALQRIKGAAAA